MSVAAIILAAGRGTRFADGPKLLAELNGRPLVRHVAEAALRSRARPVLAVVGHAGQAVGAALAGLAVTIVPNPAYADGLSTSLRAGLAALPPEAEAAIVLLGDMPLVSERAIDRLIEAWRAEPHQAAAVPVVGGRRGNPVLLSRSLEPAIGALRGDRGAGPLLATHAAVIDVSLDDESLLVDVDTAAALQDVSRSFDARSARQRSEQ